MTKELALEAKKLSHSWLGQSPTLSIDSLQVCSGKSLFVQGASGSGKSTLLNIISGVLPVQQGQLKLLGQDMTALSQGQRDQFRADHIGYIFQQFNLLPYLSALDNVLLPLAVSKKRCAGKSKHQISEEASHWLNQLNIPLQKFKQPISQLSIGQQQRVAAARALIGAPEIIIADEPTSSLDASNVENFMTVLSQQCRSIQSSLIFVSHDQQLSSYFDQSIHLSSHDAESA